MSKLFITNATGYIGSAVAKHFKQKGYEVTALARNEDAVRRLTEVGIKAHQGDLQRPDSYLDAVRNTDIVIHTASTNDANFAQYDELTVNSIIEALAGTNKTFIYTSGTWVLGDTAGQPANEETPYNPLPLVAFRPKVEKRVLDAAEKDIRTIVIRPAIVYGQNRGIIAGLFEQARKDGKVRYIGKGTNHWSFVNVEDLAELYLAAAERGSAGSLFNASNGEFLTTREVAEHVANAAGIPNKIESWTLEEARQVLHSFADGFAVDQKIDASRALRVLGWQAKRPSLVQHLATEKKELAGSHK